ncbi:MAG: YdcF family protein [Candidatus Brocadiales bacterium]|nr:YdcF family protein [Candidatus Bathyanammoxibius sp.]
MMSLGQFLIVDEPPVQSDIIIVSSDDVDRIPYGAELVKRGIATRLLVLISPEDCPIFLPMDCAALIIERLKTLGISHDQVQIEDRTHSTYTDATLSRERMEKAGFRSAVVISDPFHMRRVTWAWRRVFADSSVRLTFDAIPFEYRGLALDGWWTREIQSVQVFSEYVKLGLYWAKGYL